MGYMHIGNLYKEKDILAYKEVYALEKIHGTSAHISWKDGKVNYSPGGTKMETFLNIFKTQIAKYGETQSLFDFLPTAFTELGHPEVVVFGESYGGKEQGMSETYGKVAKFVVFDVKIGECWLDVPHAESVAKQLGLEFVDYALVPTTLEALNAERDKDSTQAIRNGMGPGKKREGVVLRPPFEVRKNNGERIIAKHKREDFKETKTSRPIDAERLKVLSDAEEIAIEWVTEMRLTHVLDKLPGVGIENMGDIIKAMIEDVEREATGEIVVSKEARKAIGNRTVAMFKIRLQEQLKRDAQ